MRTKYVHKYEPSLLKSVCDHGPHPISHRLCTNLHPCAFIKSIQCVNSALCSLSKLIIIKQYLSNKRRHMNPHIYPHSTDYTAGFSRTRARFTPHLGQGRPSGKLHRAGDSLGAGRRSLLCTLLADKLCCACRNVGNVALRDFGILIR